MSEQNKDFLGTLRKSLAELFDELMAFITFLSATLTGLYFQSWIVFISVLVTGFIITGVLHKRMSGSKT